MSCEAVREQILTDDAAGLRELEHLERCPSCAAWVGRIVEHEQRLDGLLEDHGRAVPFDQAWSRAQQAGPVEPAQARLTWIHGVGLALAAAAALALVLFGPGGAEVERPARAPLAPEPEVVVGDRIDRMPLTVGHSLVLQLPVPPTSVLSEGPEVAVIESLGAGWLALHGRGVGATRLVARFDGKPDRTYDVEVKAPPADGEADLQLAVGERLSRSWERTVAGVTVALPEVVRVSLDEVGDVTLQAVGAGSTTVAVVFQESGPPVLLSVEVVE